MKWRALSFDSNMVDEGQGPVTSMEDLKVAGKRNKDTKCIVSHLDTYGVLAWLQKEKGEV